tara:strand:+ start:49 stop:420 length:372 start_codon:yes stop_codon:yes gene_type:complete
MFGLFMHKKKFISNKRKFTLVELMFCVGILIILIGIGWINGAKVLRKSADTQIKAEIKQISALIRVYYDDHKVFPVKDDKILAEYLDYKMLNVQDGYFVDPYDEPYEMTVTGQAYKIRSSSHP